MKGGWPPCSINLAEGEASLFFKNHPLSVIIDEVQRAPDLFLQIILLAYNSKEKGQIILTGSQSYRLLSKAADSMEWEPFYRS